MNDDVQRGWRLFTVEEATELLSEVEPALRRMRAAADELREVIRRRAELTPAMRANGSGMEALRLEAAQERLRQTLQETVDRIAALGVVVKDIEEGIVDFPSWQEGRVVFLCYRQGEDALRFWHELDEGFAGRQPIDFTGEAEDDSTEAE